MELSLHPEYNLYEKNDKVFCSSLQVAEEFAKRHDNVLADIRKLDCTEDFRRANYHSVRRTVDLGFGRIRRDPMYYITEYGFVFLAMAYRTKRCALIREDIIRRFDTMKKSIIKYAITREEFPELAQAVESIYDEPRSYYYNGELDMLKGIVLGLVNEHDIYVRLSDDQFKAILKLQKEDIRLMYNKIDFQQRKVILSDFYQAGMNGHIDLKSL